MNRRIVLRLLLTAALAAGITLAFMYREQLNASSLENWVREAGPAAPLAFMAIYVVGTVLFFPGAVLTLVGGALFGPVWGTFYNLTAATLGATLAFLVARYLAQSWVTQRVGGRLKQVLDGVDSEGWRFVAFVRLVPLFPFNLLNYALGLTRIRLWHYVLASYVFMLPGAIAYTYLGYAGREAVAGGEGMIQKGLLALALLAVVAFLPRLVKRLRGGDVTGATLTAAELCGKLNNVHVLDVRTAKDFAAPGTIKSAKNIPVEEMTQRIGEIEAWRHEPIAVICRTNRRSGQAVRLLQAAGFTQPILVTDGMVGWEKLGNPSAPAVDGCGAVSVPTGPSTGTGKTVTIVIQNAPYRGDNKAWHALRFAGAALAEDMKVRVHLLDDGAQLARRGQQVPPGAVDLEKLLTELMEYGLEVRACGMALGECKLDERDLIPGIQLGSMKALAGWVKESDLVLTF
jgi:uncharacterized membrane protein YdjX (TVP38/TMEM64 family)/rhodanese-related sulfurtransferase/sulfur relay (sulfurtransferase) complex TusBCD TusD component (DsrE family)